MACTDKPDPTLLDIELRTDQTALQSAQSVAMAAVVKNRNSPTSLPQSEAIKQILDRKKSLRELAATLDTAGIEYEIRGDIGNPVERIVMILEGVNADFVVVSSQDRSHVRERLFGSIAQNLLRFAPCPVITVRADIYEE